MIEAVPYVAVGTSLLFFGNEFRKRIDIEFYKPDDTDEVEEAEAEAIEAAQERYTDPDDDYTILDYENDLEDILDETEEIKEDDEDEDEPETEDDAGSDEAFKREIIRQSAADAKRGQWDRTTDQIKSDIVDHLFENLEAAVHSGSPLRFNPHGGHIIANVIQSTLRQYADDLTVNAPSYDELSRADKANHCWTGIEFHLRSNETGDTIAGEISVGQTIHIELDDIEETKRQMAEEMGLGEEYRKATEEEPRIERHRIHRNYGFSTTAHIHRLKIALPDTDPRNSTLEMIFDSNETVNLRVKNQDGNLVTLSEAMITDISSIGADTLDGKSIGSNVYTVEATERTAGASGPVDIDLTGRPDPVDREPLLEGHTMY